MHLKFSRVYIIVAHFLAFFKIEIIEIHHVAQIEPVILQL